MPDLSGIVDLERYPVNSVRSEPYCQLLNTVRLALADDGCAVIPGFVLPEAIDALVGEAENVADKAHRSFNITNPYFGIDDPSLEQSHPKRRFYERSNAFVPADNFGSHSLLRALYEWPHFALFVQQALQEENFYPYADPLADVIINVVELGNGFPWHFDTNNFTVTLGIQNGDSGGVFEYVPNLRTPTEENYNGVRAVLDGDHREVKQLHLRPGDLQLFRGRYSMHRVTAVSGTTSRYVGIFSFVEQPGMVAKVERAKQLYGRALPVHYECENERLDTLLD